MKLLKERLREHTPSRYQAMPEFNILLKLITKEKITTKTALKRHLNAEIKKLEREIDQLGGGSTMNRKRVRIAKKVDFLRKCHDKLLPYC